MNLKPGDTLTLRATEEEIKMGICGRTPINDESGLAMHLCRLQRS